MRMLTPILMPILIPRLRAMPMPMPWPRQANAILLAALALLLPAAAHAGAPSLEARGSTLVFHRGDLTATFSATAEGALRVTATLDGVTPEPLRGRSSSLLPRVPRSSAARGSLSAPTRSRSRATASRCRRAAGRTTPSPSRATAPT